MVLKRREVLLGLASASIPIILASCGGGEKTEEAAKPTTQSENASPAPAGDNAGKFPETVHVKP